LQAGIRSGVLDDQAIRRIAEDSPWRGSPEEPLVEAYQALQYQTAAFQTAAFSLGADLRGVPLGPLEDRAIQGAHALAESRVLWTTMTEIVRVWSLEDSTFAEAMLARSSDEFVEAEAEILGNNGLSQPAAAMLAIEAAETHVVGFGLPDPELARRQIEVLAEEIRREHMLEEAQEDRKDRRFLRRLRRIGRVAHLLGGGILMLADVGSVAATALTTPLATIGTGAVAVVSIKKGSDLIRLGVGDKFAGG
jgi:hypothetical protein